MRGAMKKKFHKHVNLERELSMEQKINNFVMRLARDVNGLVNDLGTFGCMDEDELKKTPEDKVREAYQWLSEKKGCEEASEYFRELLSIMDKSDADYQRIADICERIHSVMGMEPWEDKTPIKKDTGKCR